MASTAGVNLAISGLASGFDWQTMVTQLAQAERAPESIWSANQTKINAKNSAYTIIKSYLTQLQSSVQALKDPTIYNNRSASSSSPTVASATSASSGLTGTFKFDISQLATNASLTGTGNISAHISTTDDVSHVTVGAANFATPVTAGTFSVNGAQVTIATTDSLQDVFGKIATATGNTVTAAYDHTTDKITLSSASAIKLGSAADTSNFLQVAKLYNDNNSGTITSGDTLGRVNPADQLDKVSLGTPINDGGSGAGQFTINGVAIDFNATSTTVPLKAADTLQTIIDRINSSAAGVTASYDVVNNRFALANKTTGDVGISLSDVTGNFLAATGLSSGTVTSGQDLKYTVNDGPKLVSRSNTIDSSSSGIAGLSVTALAADKTTITVGADTSAIQTNIQNFVNQYNNVQGYITTNTASSTDSTGKVTAGTLTGDVDAGNLASNLRSNIFSSVSITGLSAGFSQLANLGITSNGYNNTVTLDSTALTKALTSNLGDIQKLFSDPTNGLGVQLDKFLTNTVGDTGTITNHQAALTASSKAIDTQIANQEKTIATDSAFWTTEFQNMETAQAKLQQELTALNQQVSNGTL